MGGMDLIFTPALARDLSGPLGLSGPMTIALLGLIAILNSLVGRYNPNLAAHPLPYTHNL